MNNNKLLFFIWMICAELRVTPPEVIIDPIFLKSNNARAALSDDGKMILPSYELNIDLAFAILHELRHAWQKKFNYYKFFNKYEHNIQNIYEYNLQFAEVDANAYATIMTEELYDCTIERPLGKLRKAILDRMSIISQDLYNPFI